MSADEGSEMGEVGDATPLLDELNEGFTPQEQQDPPNPLEPQRAAATEQTYLVLAQASSVGAPEAKWVTVGEVIVPPRTRRATVLETALGLFPQHVPALGTPARGFMVIDAENALPIEVTVDPPEPAEPVLRIGG